jgi:hypothetical protein
MEGSPQHPGTEEYDKQDVEKPYRQQILRLLSVGECLHCIGAWFLVGTCIVIMLVSQEAKTPA